MWRRTKQNGGNYVKEKSNWEIKQQRNKKRKRKKTKVKKKRQRKEENKKEKKTKEKACLEIRKKRRKRKRKLVTDEEIQEEKIWIKLVQGKCKYGKITTQQLERNRIAEKQEMDENKATDKILKERKIKVEKKKTKEKDKLIKWREWKIAREKQEKKGRKRGKINRKEREKVLAK